MFFTALGPYLTVLALDTLIFFASKLCIDTLQYLYWYFILRIDVTLANLPISSYS